MAKVKRPIGSTTCTGEGCFQITAPMAQASTNVRLLRHGDRRPAVSSGKLAFPLTSTTPWLGLAWCGLAARQTGAIVSTCLLLLGALFSSLGLGCFIYGKRQQAPIPLICGLVLMIGPYFVSNAIAMLLLGAIVSAIPWLART